MVNEKRIRWGLIIVSFFFVGLAVDYFFLHILFQEKLKEQQKLEQNRTLPGTPGSSSGTTPLTPPSSPTAVAYQEPSPPTSPADFQNKVNQCLGTELAKNMTADDLVNELEKINPVKKSEFQLENTHIQLPDGSERRLHLIPSEDTNQKNGRELRYFKVDDDGLPERIPLKPEETHNPKPEFIASLMKQGKVIYHETKDSITLKDGTGLLLTKINDKVFEFQIFAHGKTLSCREINCICREK